MSIFATHHRHAMAAGFILTAASLSADEILLDHNGKISGKIESINANREVVMNSPLSPEKLLFNGESFRSIQFTEVKTKTQPHSNVLYLKNGDVLPISIDQLDERELSFKLPWSSILKAARGSIESLHFDTTDRTVIYHGPNADDWQMGKAWKFENALVSKAWGSTHRKFEAFPERYILSYTIEWQGTVNIKCIFASTTVESSSSSDCYFLQFNSGGLELKRQSQSGKKYTSLASFNGLNPDEMDSNKIHVEIGVDRTNRLLTLSINGKQLRNNIFDPYETGPLPTGTVVGFISNSGNDDRHTISDIRISTWGSNSSEARMEKRTDTKRDLLFDIESNRFSGELKSIKRGKDLEILFENPHDPSPKPRPASNVAIIYFSGDQTVAAKPAYRIKLRGFGQLLVEDFTIQGDVLKARHPVIGEMEIAVSQISEILRNP